MKKAHLALSLAALVATSPLALAHDFWLAPGKFQYDQPASVAVQFKVGHQHQADHWNLRWHKIVALRNYTPSGVKDMAAGIIPKTGIMPGAAKSSKLEPGTYIIGFESYHSVSELEAESFNEYVAEEGLKAVEQHRQANNLTKAAGTELYSRKAKTIVQVGETLSEHVTQPIGHTLEIVPVNHPARKLESGNLAVQVLFKGQPLSSAMIDVTFLDKDNQNVYTAHTGTDGTASFDLEDTGAVKLNVVWGVPLQDNSRADYETYFSSLTMQVN